MFCSHINVIATTDSHVCASYFSFIIWQCTCKCLCFICYTHMWLAVYFSLTILFKKRAKMVERSDFFHYQLQFVIKFCLFKYDFGLFIYHRYYIIYRPINRLISPKKKTIKIGRVQKIDWSNGWYEMSLRLTLYAQKSQLNHK